MMDGAVITGLLGAITGQYLLLIKIYTKLMQIKAEFKACPQHRLIFNNGGELN